MSEFLEKLRKVWLQEKPTMGREIIQMCKRYDLDLGVIKLWERGMYTHLPIRYIHSLVIFLNNEELMILFTKERENIESKSTYKLVPNTEMHKRWEFFESFQGINFFHANTRRMLNMKIKQAYETENDEEEFSRIGIYVYFLKYDYGYPTDQWEFDIWNPLNVSQLGTLRKSPRVYLQHKSWEDSDSTSGSTSSTEKDIVALGTEKVLDFFYRMDM